MTLPSRPPAVHYNYDELDVTCQCALCTAYRTAKIHYEDVRDVKLRHSRFCRCEACQENSNAFLVYLAASNQRDIYSEVSYILASPPKPHKLTADCMLWIYDEIAAGPREAKWWALYSDRKTLGSWIRDFQEVWGAAHGLPATVWAVSGLC